MNCLDSTDGAQKKKINIYFFILYLFRKWFFSSAKHMEKIQDDDTEKHVWNRYNPHSDKGSFSTLLIFVNIFCKHF